MRGEVRGVPAADQTRFPVTGRSLTRHDSAHVDNPDYAILSHVWGKDEISFQAFRDKTYSASLPAYAKIRGCCNATLVSNIESVWIDACCIDKTNSTELSKSINSMFRWYKNSLCCFAYLCDAKEADHPSGSRWFESRWFRRGWTLQELLAPRQVFFYSADWKILGKSFILALERMSWALKYVTNEPEDIIYCLLGLFDVNMPFLYREGAVRAFRRL
ncbi:heterokaryon incompatibility protein-domain-containing protein [Rhypophila decipiens]|uniref:Heterokaryon incompatibility protein-domain-containing protein n=1 Tax=Rhypophila decipiens TaxID=261697 RepID=A0AAN7B682_9PEZI|nr:heterokaryon incompatibility protein-domain-containing protein [Rhypophila decipiens]